jgi:hypothetical protein
MSNANGVNPTANSPEITETRSKSFSNPIKAFRERRASKANTADIKAGTNMPTDLDAADRTPLVARADQSSVSATNSSEQETFVDLMRATRNMSPAEVKAYLEQKARADHEKHKNEVSRLGDGSDMVWIPNELQTTWSGKNFGSY